MACWSPAKLQWHYECGTSRSVFWRKPVHKALQLLLAFFLKFFLPSPSLLTLIWKTPKTLTLTRTSWLLDQFGVMLLWDGKASITVERKGNISGITYCDRVMTVHLLNVHSLILSSTRAWSQQTQIQMWMKGKVVKIVTTRRFMKQLLPPPKRVMFSVWFPYLLVCQQGLQKNYWPDCYETWCKDVAWVKGEHIKIWSGSKSRGRYTNYFSLWFT